MREDMFKVIVEHPRWGSRFPFKQRRAADLDEDAPARESIKYRHVARKSLSENLNPLRRWLEAQVDRPWSKVYAELCANIDVRSTVQQHIRQHVGDFVAINVILIDGVRHVADEYGPVPLAEDGARLFVDPVTGILRRNREGARHRAERVADWRRRREPACPHPRVMLGADRQLHRLDGTWFEVMLAPVPPKPGKPQRWDPRPFDVVRHRDAWSCPTYLAEGKVPGNFELYGDSRLYAATRRQLDRNELRRHGLVNDNA
jgi:hypothetical protein